MCRRQEHAKYYLRRDHIDWLISFAADELRFQGVPNNPDAVAGAKVGNCDEIPDVYMEWDFSKSAWTAELLSDQMKGTMLSFATTELTRDRCETVSYTHLTLPTKRIV